MHKKKVNGKFYYYTTVRNDSLTRSVYLGKDFSEAKKREGQLFSKTSNFKWKTFSFITLLIIIFGIGVCYGYFNPTGFATIQDYQIQQDTTPPGIEFVEPTLPDLTQTTNTSIEANVSITEIQLANFTWNWNGTNYSIYDEDIVLMLNFDNVSALGENESDIMDLSSYGNNGTFYNNATTGIGTDVDVSGTNESGKYNGCYAFDSDGDYVDFPNSDSLNITTAITIALWEKTPPSFDVTNEWGMSLVGRGEFGDPKNTMQLRIRATGDQLAFSYEYGVGTTSLTAIGTTDVADGNWHFVVGQWNTTHCLLYADGRLENNTPCTNTPGPFDEQFSIGKDISNGSGQDFFNGTIDEVRIWNRTLTADEINETYMSNLHKYDTDKWAFYTNQSATPDSGLPDGDYTYFANAKDSAGNENMTEERTVTVDTVFPVVSLDSPVDFYNETGSGFVTFNYTGTDANLGVCELWGNWSGGWHMNESFISPTSGVTNGSSNITLEDGVYVWTVYCNDTANNYNNTVDNFTLVVNASVPLINLNAPVDFANFSTALDFNYTAVDGDLDTCELWGNWTTGWHLNESFVSPSSGSANGSSVLTLEDGQYVWTVYCNDTTNNYNNTVQNFTLTVDLTAPLVGLDDPVDFYNETATGGVVFNYTATDTNGIGTCELWG